MPRNKKEQKNSENVSKLNDADAKSKRSSLKRIVVVLAILLFAALAFNSVMFFIGMKTDYLHRWGGGQYFGEITGTDSEGFVMRGRGDDRVTILITGKTIVKKGTETVNDALQTGDRVIVFGPLDGNGRVEAQLVRVFDPKNPTNPREFFQPPF